jgi:hypothetical protein
MVALLLGCASSPDSTAIEVGMTLGEAESLIVSKGGMRCEAAYPLFWTGSEGDSGYHVYFDLADKTCLQLQVRGKFVEGSQERGYPILRLTLGPKGEPYSGKIRWFEDEKQGKHESVRSVVLSSHGPARRR